MADGENKACTKCGAVRPATTEYFHVDRRLRSGLASRCKECQHEWYVENKDRIREARRAQWRIWSENNKEYRREYNRNYRRANQERYRDYNRERRANTPHLRVHDSISRGINKALKNGKTGRRWESLVGYTLTDLMTHLESQFTKGMTWDNYGRGGWHIDHIRPKADFNFDSPDDTEFLQCWSLWNLQPLWGRVNMAKNARCDAPPLPLIHGDKDES